MASKDMSMKNKQKSREEFNHKIAKPIIDTAYRHSGYEGMAAERFVDEVWDWHTKALSQREAEVREETLRDLKKVLQKSFTPDVEEQIFEELSQLKNQDE